MEAVPDRNITIHSQNPSSRSFIPLITFTAAPTDAGSGVLREDFWGSKHRTPVPASVGALSGGCPQ